MVCMGKLEQWLANGDKNTNFFPPIGIQPSKRNRIDRVMGPNRETLR